MGENWSNIHVETLDPVSPTGQFNISIPSMSFDDNKHSV